ncbi:LLM class flavin-dependent oxidoreductase [Sphingomonas nostoxanthinifaciens]|uniref:LLM class flavin-dependent oxidoreductase n=1 Tax=Sphingomonas nostoxanthinifaciens TaxID=2872652 RepID=UPI001CC1D134|nr:LLM class flavin-dependent oxidoreductase [Sphingomonas nostoxanthinifaciens]UAK24662.1 LLM class flavin-dependent oxidoreductase [Sphingomonas nostoxanthinifaciens]
MTYTLSVLDQSPIAADSDAAQAVRNTLDLARTCDALGYERYWLAEHHASPALAGSAPEALIGPVALATARIRVGSGGIMLPHYSPFKVAETFALLSALAPGRIDLGLGRAPGSDQRTALALQRDRSRYMPNDFPDQLAELTGYLDGTLDDGHPFAALQATIPSGGGGPELWMLGSSPDSARWAAERGMPYCFADFINSDGAMLARSYRSNFRPSARQAEPRVMVATWAIAADSTAEAERLAAPSRMMFAHLIAGRLIAVPSVDDALVWLEANPLAAQRNRRMTLGTAHDVHQQLDGVADAYGADEMMLVNIMPDRAARRRSYELIAAEYGLARSAAAA